MPNYPYFLERVTPTGIFLQNMVFLFHLSIKCDKMPTITQMGKMQKILYQRSEVKPFLFFLHLALSPQGLLTCIGVRLWVPVGVPWVQVEVCSAYVSFPRSQRDFSGYVEAGGSSSYRDPPLPFNLLLWFSLSLSKVPFQIQREREGGMEIREKEGGERRRMKSRGRERGRER